MTVSDSTTYPYIPAGVVIGEGSGNVAVVNSYLPNFSAISIVVGDHLSAGTLNVNGGSVNCATAEVPGRASLASGVATVNGADSSWNVSDDFYVGYVGNGAVTITNGGKIKSGNGYFGGFDGLAEVNIDGVGSAWTMSGALSLNSPDSGGSSTLAITNGGRVTSAGGGICFNNNYGVGPGKITVDGAGSTWNNTGSFLIGDVGRTGAGEVEILHGGQVTDTGARVGSSSADTPSKATVDGVGSTWNNAADLYIGWSPGSAELYITHGGTVTVGTDAYIFAGRNNLDRAATAAVLVDGANSSLTVARNLQVGGNAGGSLTITGGARVSDASALVYPKSVNIPGTVLVDGPGSIWTTSGDIILDGLLTQSNGGRVVVGGLLLIQEAGELQGNGRLMGDVSNGVLVAPGASLGRLTIAGNYAQVSTGTLQIDLGGLSPGTDFDQLSVMGSTTLDGTLSVSLVNSFSPKLGDSFDILDWGTLSGTFSTLQLPALGNNLAWDTSQLYTTGVISVTTVPEPRTAVLFAMAAPALFAASMRRRKPRRYRWSHAACRQAAPRDVSQAQGV